MSHASAFYTDLKGPTIWYELIPYFHLFQNRNVSDSSYQSHCSETLHVACTTWVCKHEWCGFCRWITFNLGMHSNRIDTHFRNLVIFILSNWNSGFSEWRLPITLIHQCDKTMRSELLTIVAPPCHSYLAKIIPPRLCPPFDCTRKHLYSISFWNRVISNGLCQSDSSKTLCGLLKASMRV